MVRYAGDRVFTFHYPSEAKRFYRILPERLNKYGLELHDDGKSPLIPAGHVAAMRASKHHKAFMADLKPVYRAVSKEAAESALDELGEKWGAQYPVVLQSWRRKWDNLSHYFRYPATIRKVIYTTNTIESVHRQFRKLTKTKGAFP